MSELSSSIKHKKLGWFLCWAVVFADIGTSIYYVPGILFGEVKNLAGLFVLMSSAVFVLLAMKYIEITDRYPEGGGVVTVATHAFGPWYGALGGMFITVDYFLTASISAISGFAYLNSIVHIGGYILILSIAAIIFLGILNIIGIKESAGVTAVIAVAAFIVDIIVVGFVASQIGPEGWKVVFMSLTRVSTLTPWHVLTGFAGSFLAFSGLESISQLSPAMQTPRKKVAGIAMWVVIASVMITSPFLTLFSTNLITAKPEHMNETVLQLVSHVSAREEQLLKTTDPKKRAVLSMQIELGKRLSERFISELGASYGGIMVKIAVVATASILLIFASNTAIIGAYHVFIALSRQNFLPQIVQKHNNKFGTPHWSVIAATIPPILIILATKGDVTLLGELYAFGLLGAFGLSSIGLDVVRWQESKKLSPTFVMGIITSALVMTAWITNLYSKTLATSFGGAVTIVGMALAYVIHTRTMKAQIEGPVIIADTAVIPAGQLFIPVYDEFDQSLFAFAGSYARLHKKHVSVMYIREFTDVLQTVSESIDIDEEARTFLHKARRALSRYGVTVHLLYEATDDAGATINDYRKKLNPSMTVLSPHERSGILDFLHGDIVKKVINFKNGSVMIHTGAKPEDGHPAITVSPAHAVA